MLTATGTLDKTGGGLNWLLNFDQTEGPVDNFWAASGGVATDGDDRIFGDLGNDWAVGGTGRDTLWGGWGNDLLNADDNLNTASGTNLGTDTNPSYEDLAYGGAGLDVLIANTGGDRLIDWGGEFNSYLTPFSPFGMATVSRLVAPALRPLLVALAASQGADQTMVASHGGDAARNGEPFGELGVIEPGDAAWNDQHGGPRDPQPGNNKGSRDVLRTSGTLVLDAPRPSVGASTLAAAFAPTAPLAPPVATFGAATPAMDLGGGQYATTNPNVLLNLTFEGAAQMAFSLDGVNFSPLQTYAASAAVALPSLDGAYTVTTKVVDAFGNTLIDTRTVRLDRSGPTISNNTTAPTNNGSYDVGLTITVAYGASDGAGVRSVSATFDGATISSGSAVNIDTLRAGAHTIVITSTDSLGNTSSLTVTVVVRATIPGMIRAVADGVARGLIASSLLANLVKSLNSVTSANTSTSARNNLGSFINQVQSQSGKSIDAGYAALLVNWAQDLLTRL
jgi:hypothetical protein